MAGFRQSVGVGIATFFGAGRVPKAPGTAGSVVALPLIWLVETVAGRPGVALFAVGLFAAGVWASNVYVGESSDKDPGPVVVDEVVGQAVAILFLPLGLMEYLVAFILFRIFDITKLWPANYVEQKVSGGLGIMLDDVVAGLYAGVGSYLLVEVIR